MKHSDTLHYRHLIYLKRHFTVRRRRFPPVLEPAAMVDVVLIVLMFFILASPYVSRPGVRLELPETAFVDALPLNGLVLTVFKEDVAFFNDRRTPVRELDKAFSRMAFEYPDRTLVIEADDLVSYRTLLNLYQRARDAGVKEVALATRNVRGAEGE